MKLSTTILVACLLGTGASAYAEQPVVRARSAAGIHGANADAAGARRVFADGNGNVNAAGGSAFTTANGSSGSRSARFSRSADGSASAQRNATATNANTGVTYSGSATWTQGEGASRSGSCTDASGHTVTCGSAR